MKKIIVLFVLSAACFSVFAEEAGHTGSDLVGARSVFSVDAGCVSDGRDGLGYVGFIKSATFLNDSPFYYGFGSLFGGFITTGENFFETGLLAGYSRNLGETGFDLDFFLDFLVTGGRISQETLLYRSEAPALHMGLTLGFSAFSDIDCAVSLAPVIRPYNLQAGTWDFSRSYIILSFALRFKSYALVEQRRWAESITTVSTRG